MSNICKHKNNEKNELINNCIVAINCALKGKMVWLFLRYKYLRYKKFIIFPMDNQDYNAWGIIMLQSYLKKEKIEEAVVLAGNSNIYKAIKFLDLNNIRFQLLKSQYIRCLMKYYALVDMSESWTVVSVTEPYDTGAERLLGIKQVTQKEIVYYDIYKFSNRDIEKEIGEAIKKENDIKEILGDKMTL